MSTTITGNAPTLYRPVDDSPAQVRDARAIIRKDAPPATSCRLGKVAHISEELIDWIKQWILKNTETQCVCFTGRSEDRVGDFAEDIIYPNATLHIEAVVYEEWSIERGDHFHPNSEELISQYIEIADFALISHEDDSHIRTNFNRKAFNDEQKKKARLQ